jgi:hypothetical protein
MLHGKWCIGYCLVLVDIFIEWIRSSEVFAVIGFLHCARYSALQVEDDEITRRHAETGAPRANWWAIGLNKGETVIDNTLNSHLIYQYMLHSNNTIHSSMK